MFKYFRFKKNSHWGVTTRTTGYYINENNYYHEKYLLPAIRFTHGIDDDMGTVLQHEFDIEIVWWTFIFAITYFKTEKIGA